MAMRPRLVRVTISWGEVMVVEVCEVVESLGEEKNRD